MIESGFALMVAFLINISVISVTGAVCNSSNMNPEDQKSCEDLDLNKASFLLRVCDPEIFANTWKFFLVLLGISYMFINLTVSQFPFFLNSLLS